MIAFLCATPRELNCLTNLLYECHEVPSPAGTRLKEGRYGGVELIALACGVGKAAAASGGRHLMDRYRPEALFNYGVAGALKKDVKTGDLVIADHSISGDVGIAHSKGFTPTGPGLCRDKGLVFQPRYPSSGRLSELARAAAEMAGCPYHIGHLLTCDQLVLDPELRKHLGELFDALGVEMEGAAAAHAAMGEGLPFIAVRAVSDELEYDFSALGKTLPFEGQSRRHLWGKRFLLSVTHPSSVAKVRELGHGMDLALASMARFLEAFLHILGDLQHDA